MNLESYDEVKKWISQVKESSRGPYLSGMRAYIEFTGLNPEELIDEAEEDRQKPRRERGRPEQRLAEFWNHLLKKGYSKSLASLYITAMRSFYRRNGFPIMTKAPKASVKKENRKRALAPADVKKLVDHAPTLRDRAIILMMFQGGFDVSTICSLNYGDVARELEAGIEPLMIGVVREKEEVEYTTFVGSDAVEALRAYLDERRSKGEELRLDVPLFVKEGSKKKTRQRITPNLIQNMLRDVALKAGLVTQEELENADLNPCRPHALRSSFSTILRLNGFDPLVIDYMQGHMLPYGGAYLIPPPEKLREMYAEVEPQLSISQRHPVEKKLEERLKAYREDLKDLQAENERLRKELESMKKRLSQLERVDELEDRITEKILQDDEILLKLRLRLLSE